MFGKSEKMNQDQKKYQSNSCNHLAPSKGWKPTNDEKSYLYWENVIGRSEIAGKDLAKELDKVVKDFHFQLLALIDTFCSKVAENEELRHRRLPLFTSQEIWLFEHRQRNAILLETMEKIKAIIFAIMEDHI